MSEKNSQLDYYLAQANAKEAISRLKEYFLGNVGQDFLQTSNNNPLSFNQDKSKLDVLTSLLDTTSGAYFIKDILSGEVDLQIQDDYLKILYNGGGTSLEYSTKMNDIIKQKVAVYNNKIKKKEDENGNLTEENATNSAGELILVPGAAPSDIIRQNIVSNSGTPSRFNNLSLAAVEIKNVQYSIGNRNNDLNNLFFNSIPPLEMSRATPFIQFKLVTSENHLYKNNLSSPFFFRFFKSQNGMYELDDNAGLSKGRSFIESQGIGSTLSISNRGKSYNTAGMELFTSPQTLVNANIRRGDENLFNEEILDPFQPLMSLKSLKFDNTGLGGSLYTSKSATVELVLHDRSRLKDIQPLIAAREFGLNQVLIEFGWSHPDGGPESDNDFGRIINSLRDVGLYNVQQTNFSIGAAGEVNISMTLRCTGTQEFKNVSTAAGFYTPLSVLKPQIEQIVEEYINSKIQNSSAKSLPEVRKKAKVIRNNAYSSSALIEYSKFSDLMGKAGFSEGSSIEKVADNEFLSALSNLIGISNLENESGTEELYKETAVEAIMSKVFGLTDIDPENTSDPMLNSLSTGYNNEGITYDSKDYVSLGRVICTMIGASFAGTGRFDEVQVFFYPLNSKSGGARKYTTAGFPINKSTFRECMEKEIQSAPNMSISTFVGTLGRKILNNDSYEVYGIQNQVKLKEDTVKQFKDQIKILKDKLKSELSSTVSDEQKKAIQAAFEEEKKFLIESANEMDENADSEIENALIEIYSKDGGPSVEPVFKNPILKYYIENLPVISPDTGQLQIGQKSICRIHIYDKEAIVSPLAERLNDLISTYAQSREIKSISTNNLDEQDNIEDFTDSQTFKNSTTYTLSQGISARDIKQKIKQRISNITLGTSTGVVKSVSVSAQPGGGQLSTVLLLDAISESDKTKTKTNQAQIDLKNDVEVVPGQVSLTCLGNPCIQHASQFYVDFNSGTTLDNIYIVKNVSHTIGPGDFTTTLTLSYTGQGITSSIKKKIDDAIAANETSQTALSAAALSLGVLR